ncbi:MAG: hypothetical protein EOP10_18175 [Proteobacteria bacterium]|nr:MAG: hypothetical protein EOP10_18175 [Pseudomonadota bacterium]
MNKATTAMITIAKRNQNPKAIGHQNRARGKTCKKGMRGREIILKSFHRQAGIGGLPLAKELKIPT